MKFRITNVDSKVICAWTPRCGRGSTFKIVRGPKDDRVEAYTCFDHLPMYLFSQIEAKDGKTKEDSA